MARAALSALPRSARVVVRAPNHLGDGVMALPVLEALAHRFDVVVHAPRWGTTLYRHLAVPVYGVGKLSCGDVALLFPPSLRVAWEARRLPRRVGVSGESRRLLLTDVVQDGRHTSDTYKNLAAVFGLSAFKDPHWTPLIVPLDVQPDHVAMNPLSATPETREWGGWAELAASFSRPVVFYGGPGEEARLKAVAGGYPCRVGLSLDAFASALRQASVLISVDTGPAHFARAVGVPTVVIHGSTNAAGSGPAGSLGVEGSAPCRPCYKNHCRPVGCARLACLQIDPGLVAAAAREVWSG